MTSTQPAPVPYDGAGSLFVLGMRASILDRLGAPLIGERNCYVSDAMIKLELGLEYQEAKEVVQTNGAGFTCVNYQAPPSLKRGQIKTLQLCSPDPILLEMMLGGGVAYNEDGQAIGYSAPEVGVENRPNGVSLEFWTRAVVGSAYSRDLPFMHWVIPQAYVAPTKTWELTATAALTPDIDGYSIQNPNWDRGPLSDYGGPTDRVWQYLREAELPDLSPGWRTVITQTGTSPASVEPHTAGEQM